MRPLRCMAGVHCEHVVGVRYVERAEDPGGLHIYQARILELRCCRCPWAATRERRNENDPPAWSFVEREW